MIRITTVIQCPCPVMRTSFGRAPGLQVVRRPLSSAIRLRAGIACARRLRVRRFFAEVRQSAPPPCLIRVGEAPTMWGRGGDMGRYDEIFRRSIEKPDEFWAEAAQALRWRKPWTRVLDKASPRRPRWFEGGELNTCENAL